MRHRFTEHPQSVGENYFQHFIMASRFSGTMFATSIACFLHGVFPFLFVKAGSNAITVLHRSMVTNRLRIDVENET